MATVDVIYCSNVCSEEKYRMLFRDAKLMPGQQAQKYHRTFLKGMIRNGSFNVIAVSKQPISRAVSKKAFWNGERSKYENSDIIYLPFINLPVVNNVAQYWFALKELKRQIKKGYKCVLIDVLNITMGMAAVTACKKYGAKLIGIVTDLPEFLAGNKEAFYAKMGDRIIAKCDGYVLLTEQMNDLINRDRSKPYVVIEGQIDDDVELDQGKAQENNKKICLYSGSIDEVNGIDYMVKGFLDSQMPDWELHIYGDGDYRNTLETICRDNANVKYFGIQLNEKVVEAQKKADLLINPRPTDQEFVKYSFPSKNMEYMASGTPLLTTRLPGMPKEYDDHVYFIDVETAEGFADALRNVFSLSSDERRQKGMAAQKFVVENKKGSMQVKKVADIIKRIEEKEI